MNEYDIVDNDLRDRGYRTYVLGAIHRVGMAAVLEAVLGELSLTSQSEPFKRAALLECKYDLLKVINRLEDNGDIGGTKYP